MFLNIKTEHSFLQSLCKIEELIKFAKDKKIHELGIVDDIFFIDPFKFVKLCEENEIKPILGLKKEILNFTSINEIIIYPKDIPGIYYLNSLPNKISNIEMVKKENLHLVFDISFILDPKSKIKMLQEEELAEKKNNLEKKIEKLKSYFDEINLEDYNFSYNEQLLLLSESKYLKDKMIYNEEIKYLNKDDVDYYLVLSSIYKKNTYLEEKSFKTMAKQYSFEYQIQKIEHIDKNILENTKLIVENINIKFLKVEYSKVLDFEKFKKVKFRDFLITKLNNYLENNEQKKDKKVEYEKRLYLELETIEKMKFQNYFLIMQDIINYLNKEHIKYGYGRGSAAGSLVSFLLNITKIDPLDYDLYFERFLNIKRATLPDIDLDVSDVHRQQLINFLINKYGSSKVAKICTLNKYLVKSAFNDVAKSLGYDKNLIKKISSNLSSWKTFEENIKNNYQFFSKYENDIKFEFLKETVNKIEGLSKNISIHAAGLCISNVDLTNAGFIEDNTILSEAKTLEQIGFIKFDLLGLSTLSFVNKMEKKIQIIDNEYLKDNIPLNYAPVYKALSNAKTLGVFQLESRGIRQVLQKYKPQTVLDIAIVIAMYRPGPMENIDNLIINKQNPDKIKYFHKDLEPILKQTYGIMVFQEQIMEIVKVVANFTNGEADIFRVAMSKKQLKNMEIYKNKFIEEGIKNGYKEYTLKTLYDSILKFAGYGFNKAHAVSYARMIYQIMYIKTKYPTIFYDELFKNSINSNDKEHFLLELELANVKILNPSVVDLKLENTLQRGKIILGLNYVKGINKIKKEQILINIKKMLQKGEKKYESDLIFLLENIILPVDLDDKEKLSLVGSGFFDTYNINRKSIYETLQKYNSLDLNILKLTKEHIKITSSLDFSFLENSKIENDSIGFNLKYSPEQYLYKKFKKIYPTMSIVDLTYEQKDLEINKPYFIIGSVININQIKTKTNKNMAFLKCKMNLKEVDITVFPKQYEKFIEKIVEYKGQYIVFKIIRNKQDSLILEDIIY